MPIMVLIYQAAVVGTILFARMYSVRAATVAACLWSATTLILVFMPWLMILQLAVVWGSFWYFSSNNALELPNEGSTRTWALTAAVCLCATPFLFPLVFVFAGALVALLRGLRNARTADLPVIPLENVSKETPRWKAHYARACESPAESAFLAAMISRYALLPHAGVLRGRGIDLEMQVPIGRYRADFVANRTLVVEIDGARWHGSPEARRRDAIRDAEMRAIGFEVIRIPAKTVFRTPSRATTMVENASHGHHASSATAI